MNPAKEHTLSFRCVALLYAIALSSGLIQLALFSNAVIFMANNDFILHCTLTIVRYPKYMGWAGFLSMAVFHLPLMFNRRCGFYKLLGCGKNGTFDMHPDWRQWGTLVIEKTNPEPRTSNLEPQTSNFIKAWFRFFHCEVWTIVLEPIEGHGTWDGKKAFGELPKQTDYEGPIATLTRATIRIKRLKNFWKHVDAAAAEMRAAPGFITSIGIGELPWIKQATFSVWQSKADMKNFAYKMQHHAEVIRKTRKENWYSEDMFVRFKVISAGGNLSGKNPLQGIL